MRIRVQLLQTGGSLVRKGRQIHHFPPAGGVPGRPAHDAGGPARGRGLPLAQAVRVDVVPTPPAPGGGLGEFLEADRARRVRERPRGHLGARPLRCVIPPLQPVTRHHIPVRHPTPQHLQDPLQLRRTQRSLPHPPVLPGQARHPEHHEQHVLTHAPPLLEVRAGAALPVRGQGHGVHIASAAHDIQPGLVLLNFRGHQIQPVSKCPLDTLLDVVRRLRNQAPHATVSLTLRWTFGLGFLRKLSLDAEHCLQWGNCKLLLRSSLLPTQRPLGRRCQPAGCSLLPLLLSLKKLQQALLLPHVHLPQLLLVVLRRLPAAPGHGHGLPPPRLRRTGAPGR
mmetsp:Transcript_5093/g.12590  ORF Transcript_5093/g.12590 Transcript_5093/m.12590 type:complete len:337 (-) Transcript_5093:681-1691(-)